VEYEKEMLTRRNINDEAINYWERGLKGSDKNKNLTLIGKPKLPTLNNFISETTTDVF
jgi:hypothetical protein